MEEYAGTGRVVAAVGDGSPTSNRVERLRRRYDALKGSSERSNAEQTWQKISEVMSPRKQDYVGRRTEGERRMQKVYDSTGIHAVNLLAAGLHGMATNPAARWFSLRVVADKVDSVDEQGNPVKVSLSEIPEVREWLSDVEAIMWQRLYSPGTNFTTALHEVYLDLSSVGTAILFVGQQDSGGLLFDCRSLAECVYSENADGRIDTVFRCTEFTVRQIIQMSNRMGWRVSEETQKKYEDEKYEERIKVIHAVYPRAERDPSKKNAQNHPYVSCYFEHEAEHLLSEDGFTEFPYLIARWSKYGTEIYGRGPGHVALPDVQMLQAMALSKIKVVNKAADPPMWIRDDGFVGQPRTVPGGVNFFRGDPNSGVMLHPVSLQGLQFLADDIQQLRQQILKTFSADLMQMADRANMTATEVIQRTSEMMRLFGPLIGRLEGEMLGPLVDRVFGILGREGLIPPAPEVIEDMDYTVEFVSPVATAQKQTQADGIMQVFSIFSMFGPEVAAQIINQNVDTNKMFTYLWALFNNEPDVLKKPEQIEQENQMAMAQQGMGMAEQGAGIASQGASAVKNLSDASAMANPESGSGIDPANLLAQMANGMSENPEAMQELQDLGMGDLMERTS